MLTLRLPQSTKGLTNAGTWLAVLGLVIPSMQPGSNKATARQRQCRNRFLLRLPAQVIGRIYAASPCGALTTIPVTGIRPVFRSSKLRVERLFLARQTPANRATGLVGCTRLHTEQRRQPHLINWFSIRVFSTAALIQAETDGNTCWRVTSRPSQISLSA